jgi:hypothetical protein
MQGYERVGLAGSDIRSLNATGVIVPCYRKLNVIKLIVILKISNMKKGIANVEYQRMHKHSLFKNSLFLVSCSLLFPFHHSLALIQL